MCTFNRKIIEKTVRIYGKNDKYLGSKTVPINQSVRDYQRSLYTEYPDWKYTTEN